MLDIANLSRSKKCGDKYLLLKSLEDLWKVKIIGTMCKSSLCFRNITIQNTA